MIHEEQTRVAPTAYCFDGVATNGVAVAESATCNEGRTTAENAAGCGVTCATFVSATDPTIRKAKCESAGLCTYVGAVFDSTGAFPILTTSDQCGSTDHAACSVATSLSACNGAANDCFWTGAANDPVTAGRITSALVCEGFSFSACNDDNGLPTTTPYYTNADCLSAANTNKWEAGHPTDDRPENPNVWFGTCSAAVDGKTKIDKRTCTDAGNTWTMTPPVGTWTGRMEIEASRLHDADAANSELGGLTSSGVWKSTKMLEAAVPQLSPDSKFDQWIQFTAKEYLYFSLKARLASPFFVPSDELVQTFVIAKLLSLKGTIVVEPQQADCAIGSDGKAVNGCDPYNILVSSSGMFWNSRPGATLSYVAVSLYLPSEWKIDQDAQGVETGKTCGMAYCQEITTQTVSSVVTRTLTTKTAVCMRPGRCSDASKFTDGTCTSPEIWTPGCVSVAGATVAAGTTKDLCTAAGATNIWKESADWSQSESQCNLLPTGPRWKPSVDQVDCSALGASKWMPSTGCPLTDPTVVGGPDYSATWATTHDSASSMWLQPQMPPTTCTDSAATGFDTDPEKCGCQERLGRTVALYCRASASYQIR
jgi:hypothetical protein